jgi:putative ABC transport system substrate-binding protein
MRRRNFLAFLASIPAATCISPASAQQDGRRRRIGILFGLAETDPQARKYLNAFREALRSLGWSEGQNLQIDFRSATNLETLRSLTSDLISLKPDLVLTYTTPATNAVHQVTRSVPILFVAVSDPIGTEFVKSFSHPEGNITGFTNFEPTMGSKWVQLIREIAPSVQRVAMLFNPATANAGASGGVYLQSMKAAASALGLELIVTPVSDPSEIDGAFAAVAEKAGGGLIVMPNVFTAVHQERIVAQAARFRVPTIYPLSHFVNAGGLMSYGIDYTEQFRLAASYADRILRGTKPAELPVQQPTKFELVINRKTAQELGLTIPPSLLATADTLIE